MADARASLDLVVIGAGIVGLAVARDFLLRHPGAAVAVLEQEQQVAAHQSGHNSGVVHAGIYYRPGSLKAALCVEGARLLGEFCAEHGVPLHRPGKLIVARDEQEVAPLRELFARGRAAHVPDLAWVEGPAIAELEPHVRGAAAVHSPGTGVVDYTRVCRVLADVLRAQGVAVRLGTRVRRVVPAPGGQALVEVDGGEPLPARQVVVCAGAWTDVLARRGGAPADPRIVPFRGAYLGVRPLRSDGTPWVRGMVYPVPDPALPFLGVHLTRHVDGSLTLGPTAFLALSRRGYRVSDVSAVDTAGTLAWPGTWRVGRRFWRTAVDEVSMAASRRAMVRAARAYAPELTVADLDGTQHAGVRAQAVGRDGSLVDDFVVHRTGPVTYVRNAPSPAATSSLALARHLVDGLAPTG